MSASSSPSPDSGDTDDTLASDGRRSLEPLGRRRTAALDADPGLGFLAARASTAPTRGEEIGRYVVLDPLGAGAMGVVLAAYDPELDRKIALKLIKRRGPVALQAHARLKREAQALARLNHPNVVTVYDVGIHDDQLFIAMEFIAGQTLREWMDEGPHPWEQVMETLDAAGRGLAAAHAAGLVHRDFKPDNVMIGHDGLVRVMDFGLARTGRAADEALDDEQTAPHGFDILQTQLTRTGARLGTPAYMSLEQLRGEFVDARSDQFSFCVACYEAIHGERPYRARSWMELEGVLEAGELSSSASTAKVPAPLRQALARGLSPAPSDRFPDMDALLDAMRPELGSGRRWRLIVAGLAGALALAAAVLLTRDASSSAQLCELPPDKLAGIWDVEVQRNIAESFRATDAPFADDALGRVRAGLDTHVQRWRDVNAEVCAATMVRGEVPLEVMAEQMQCLDRGLRRVAGLTAVLQQADAGTVAQAPDSVSSLVPPESCRDLARSGPTTRTREESLEVEATVAKAESYAELGRYEEALRSSARATTLAAELGDVGGTGRAKLATMFAQSGLGRYEDAIESGHEAIHAAALAGDEETQARAQILLVRNYAQLGDFDRAESVGLVAQALVRDARLGKILEAQLDAKLSTIYREQQRWDESKALLEHGLELTRSIYGDDHPELAPFYNGLASLAFRSKDLDEAERQYRRALELWQTHLGPLHTSVTAVHNNLGAVHQLRGELDEARVEFQTTLDNQALVQGPDHPQNLAPTINLASIELSQGQTRAARGHYLRGLELARTQLDPRHPRAAAFALGLGRTEVDLGMSVVGEAHLREALAIYRDRHGPAHAKTADTHLALAEVLVEFDRGDEADAQRRAALAIYEAASTPDSLGKAHYARALLALREGDFAAAEAEAAAARELTLEVYGSRTEELPYRDLLIIEARLAQGDHAGALAQARIATDGPAAQPNDRRLWRLALLRAQLERHEGHDGQARQAYERALALTLGPDGNPERALVVLADMRAFVAQSDPARGAALTELAAELRRQIEDAARPPEAAITAQ
ncbi:serine/threonine kinase family protein [Plesiocystis pacifica SIR-1]|uniref:Serine/threonine kinase family protein n=1 Tax=Plesiocystis pacifica SIR-1 TaxID=391625 RepID=A6G9R3_9BACT|nr:serine/threonine-protein kinase [Plesiocystis pacifica]EDM77349.1 serine/threonine kinase family protein [Plesiocystis pacifica SIR-1]